MKNRLNLKALLPYIAIGLTVILFAVCIVLFALDDAEPAINGVEVEDSGEVILQFSDGSQKSAGRFVSKDGENGVGIAEMSVNGAGELVIGYTDGHTANMGKITGEKGLDGVNGINGIDGMNGKDGLNIKTIYVNADNDVIFVFTDDSEINIGEFSGIRGADGIDGKDGKDGLNGADGKDGTDGINGADGKDGADGINGLDGKDGEDGTDGINGSDGEDGKDGADGEDGKSVYELYKEQYGYEGTEEEWLADLLAGNLVHIVKYTVTFDANGGALPVGSLASVEVVNGRTTALPTPTREGHTFLGWHTGSGPSNGKFTDTMTIDRDLTLVAQWEVHTVTVVFKDYDDVVLDTQMINYGSAAAVPVSPSREGYYFTGWDKSFSSVKTDLVVKSLYAALTYMITYDSNGGSAVAPMQVRHTVVPAAPQDPTKQGYVFLGWYLEGMTTRYNFDIALNADTALFALWADSIPISDYAGLLAVSSDLTAKYHLTNDINVGGNEWAPLGEFSGVFDGNGYKIYNLSITASNQYAGFFSKNKGTVRNVVFDDYFMNMAYLTAETHYAGGIAAYNEGTIENCSVGGSLTTSWQFDVTNIATGTNYYCYFGGVSGHNLGSIRNCEVGADIAFASSTTARSATSGTRTLYAYNYIGSLSGENEGTMDVCSVVNSLNISTKSTAYSLNIGNSMDYYFYVMTGGAVGYNAQSGLMNRVRADIAMSMESSTHRGGPSSYDAKYAFCYSDVYGAAVIGLNRGNMRDSSSKGSIDYKTLAKSPNGLTYIYIGGAIGFNETAQAGVVVENCKAEVEISQMSADADADSQSWFGGFVGNNVQGEIKNCYATGNLNAQASYAGGFAGRNNAKINYCYAAGDVANALAAGYTGGFAGIIDSTGAIQKSFSIGAIDTTAANIGRFAGGTQPGYSVYKCYFLENSAVVNGVNPVTPTCAVGIAKTAGELQSSALLIDELVWSGEVWTLAAGEYPKLYWE